MSNKIDAKEKVQMSHKIVHQNVKCKAKVFTGTVKCQLAFGIDIRAATMVFNICFQSTDGGIVVQ